MTLIYLASPYTAPTQEQMQDRYLQACRAAAQLMGQGYVVFSPIAHSHSIAVDGGLAAEKQIDFQFWMDQDLPVLKRCDLMVILCIPGWERSRGVAREFEFAMENNIPVMFCWPREDGSIPVL